MHANVINKYRIIIAFLTSIFHREKDSIHLLVYWQLNKQFSLGESDMKEKVTIQMHIFE
jgi:hypothetical protein